MNSIQINKDIPLKTVFAQTTSPVAYCSLTIRTGTRNEGLKCAGLAHLTEHMLFKGTHFHNSSYINSRIESLGGELNAYTTKEETVICATVLKEDIAKAIDLIFEMVFCSVYDAKELEKEKNIVLDEINSYKDNPTEQIYDDFEELLFKDTVLSCPVLGNKSSLKRLSSNQMIDYVKTYFVPENMVLSVVANLEFSNLKSVVAKKFEKYKDYVPVFSEDQIDYGSKIEQNYEVFDRQCNKRSYQAHCIIGSRAYSYKDKRRMALILLANILGGPAANSALNILLREKNALVYNVDVSYNQYSDTGCVAISFGSDKTNVHKCVELIEQELEKYRTVRLSDKKLKGHKKQLLGQLLISSDNAEARCLSLGKSVLALGEIVEMDKVKTLIENIRSEDIMECANDIFKAEHLSKLIYL